ncbi:MAG: helix-turn-helix domain-containing protein [Candidatus Gracilibacteria bacterium]|jgi:sugar-specific transcriptional regulator TrmB
MNIRTEINQFLAELGLNDTEIAVYLATLELGSGPASAIAEVAQLNRVTAYEALKRLSRKGFVFVRAKKNDRTKYFTPVEYRNIIEKLKNKREAVEVALEKAESLKKEFSANFSLVEDKPVVLFYEGVEGIKIVLMDTLKEKPKEIVSFASAESLEVGFDHEFLQKYWDKRVLLGIPSRGIFPDTAKARTEFNQEKNKKELRVARFVSPEHYQFKNEIDIYGDSVGITSHTKGNEHGIIIRSQSIAESMQAVFEALWSLSVGL